MRLRYLKNVVSLELKQEDCNGCGRCLDVCPHRVFAWNNSGVQIVHRDFCMECGACAQNCPTGAVKVKAGVGCAYAIVLGRLKGTEPCCDDSDDNGPSCC